MLVLRRPVLLLAGAAAASALALSGVPSQPLAAPAPVLGPSGKAAITATYGAGENVAREHEDPVPALPDANIADLDTVGAQLKYVAQAAALPQAQGDRTWKGIGPFGQDNPASYPTGATRFARGAGMGAAAAVDPRDPSGNTLYIGTMGGLWLSKDAGTTWKVLGDGAFARSAIGAVALDPNHPGDLYAGTGIALATLSGDAPGVGVYVSHDSGATWSRPAKNVLGLRRQRHHRDAQTACSWAPAGACTLDPTTEAPLLAGWRSRPTRATPARPSGPYSDWITSTSRTRATPVEVTVAVGCATASGSARTASRCPPGNGLYRTTKGEGARSATWPAPRHARATPQASADPLGRIVLAYGASRRGSTCSGHWCRTPAAQPAAAGRARPGRHHHRPHLNATNTLLNGLYRSETTAPPGRSRPPRSRWPRPRTRACGFNPALGYGVGVQAFYNLWLAVDPLNSAQVFLGLEEVFQAVANAGPGPVRGQFEVIQKYWDLCGATTYLENIYRGFACPDQTPYYGGVCHPPGPARRPGRDD